MSFYLDFRWPQAGRRIFAVAGILAVIATVPDRVSAQSADVGVLLDRIERLERDIRTLNVQIARGGPIDSNGSGAAVAENQPAYARLNQRVSQMEGDLRNVTGAVEEMTFAVNQLRSQIDKLATDMDFRMRQVEQGRQLNAPLAGLQPPAGGQPTFQPPAATTTPSSPTTQSIGTVPGVGTSATPVDGTLPQGSQVLGTLTEAEAAAAPTVSEPAETLSEADALLAQLTGEDVSGAPAPTATPVAATPAPPPATAPSPAGVSVANEGQPATLAANQTAALPEGTPREQYMYAFGMLRQGRYDIAAQALRQFVTDHNDDPLAGNARYWLGETYYVRGAYVEAAETFLEGYQVDPDGPKAADALLKLGMSLANLDKKQEACAAFQKLRADYPGAPAGLKSTLQREWQKNGCV